ncbi:MAG: hydrogenase maturation nickel metallochaperone HypA [Candidatus Omnitrophota bacterium]|nr:hydrogenase maturation nickel metallochaperone HypA [Candidatus Omnitrophota bacterium]
MHELQLIESLVEILEKAAVSDDVGNVEEVRLEVGELRYVVPEIMENCFKHFPKSDKLKDAKLIMEMIPGGKEIMVKGIEYTEA